MTRSPCRNSCAYGAIFRKLLIWNKLSIFCPFHFKKDVLIDAYELLRCKAAPQFYKQYQHFKSCCTSQNNATALYSENHAT